MKRIGRLAVAVGLATWAMAADKRAGASRTTLSQAIEIALREVPGEALEAEIEMENGKAVVEVTVFARGRRFEVEIDGETGRVLEVEEEDGEGEGG